MPPPAEQSSGASGSLGAQERNNAPMMAIFGGAFALLLVLLLVINMLSEASVRERLDELGEGGQYRINWQQGGEGFVVMTFPGVLRIVETGESVVRGRICEQDSPFVEYAKRVYQGNRKQIVFAILEGSVSTMSEARNCIRALMPKRLLNIGWIIASNELLKSVNLNDIPPYIQNFVEP